jgi:predicted DNA-binding transcriptional regulator AlpA
VSTNDDTVIWRRELHKRLGVSSETVRRLLNAGKLPKPDVDLSLRTRGWRLSTLRSAGINL